MASDKNPKNSPHYEPIKQMILDGLTRPEIIARLKGRISEFWAGTIYREARAELGHAAPTPDRHPGGFKGRNQREKVSPLHVAIGVRLSNFRVLQKQMQVTAFTEQYEFSNPTQLPLMEAGVYDFTLVELQRLAEIMELPIEELMKTFSDNIYKKPD